MLRVGLIGVGGIASLHLGAYKLIPGVELVAVADANDERLEKVKEQYHINTYKSIDQLLLNEKPDMIDICTPTHLHVDQAVKAMDLGVNVLCEKPISLNVEGAKLIAAAANRNGVVFMAAQVTRFTPEFAYLKKVYKSKEFGELHQICLSRICSAPNAGHWSADREKSGGVALDLHIHDTDFIQYLLGKPKSVDSREKYISEQIDFISTRYQYDGPLVEAQAGWYTAVIPFSAFFRASFEKAILEYKNEALMLYEGKKEPVRLTLEEPLIIASEANVSTVNAYHHEIKYFIDCLNEKKEPEIITKDDSIMTLEIIAKEIESAKTEGRLAF